MNGNFYKINKEIAQILSWHIPYCGLLKKLRGAKNWTTLSSDREILNFITKMYVFSLFNTQINNNWKKCFIVVMLIFLNSLKFICPKLLKTNLPSYAAVLRYKNFHLSSFLFLVWNWFLYCFFVNLLRWLGD